MTYKIISEKHLKYVYKVFSDGTVLNETTNRYIKPSKDKRRPNECPIIYLCKKDNTREFHYHDILMARLFFQHYDGTQAVHHIDGDITNCSLDNLYVDDGVSVLRNIYHETVEWKPVNIEGVRFIYSYYVSEDGRLYNSTTDSFIVPFADGRESNKGYLRYTLYLDKRNTVHVSVSRLVALHYLEKPVGKDIVIFKDGDSTNVTKSNLVWGDRWDIIAYKYNLNRTHEILHDDVLGDEIWKPLVYDMEFGDEYLASNFGRIYNKTKGFYSRIHRVAQPNRMGQYHLSVCVLNKDGNYVNMSLHRAIAFTFCKNDDPINNIYVNHINGNPECNLAVNLEWVTPMENLHHAIYTNLSHSGIFIGNVTDENWRINTIMAWLHNEFNDINKEYKFYVTYINAYPDGGYLMDKKTYIAEFKDRSRNNPDFKLLDEFYKRYQRS